MTVKVQDKQDEQVQEAPKTGYTYRIWLDYHVGGERALAPGFLLNGPGYDLPMGAFDALLVTPVAIPDLQADSRARATVWRDQSGSIVSVELQQDDGPHISLLNWPLYFVPVVPEEG